MRMSENVSTNNNSDNPLTSRRTDGGKKDSLAGTPALNLHVVTHLKFHRKQNVIY